MAIQLPNPGLGDGQTGDNEFVMWTKVKDNFSNTAHAASRLVGANPTELVENRWGRRAAFTTIDGYLSTPDGSNFDTLKSGTLYLAASAGNGGPKGLGNFVSVLTMDNYDSNTALQMSYGYAVPGMSLRIKYAGSWSSWINFYHTGNTTKDGNGFLKAASPVVDLYDDHIELNNDAKKQGGITYKKLGTGDYIVKGSLGFAQEGWYIEMPKDANGNVLVAVVYEQLDNNDISVKTYDYMLNKKGRIVPDTETPLDIPEGRCINLRLHEEQLDEPIE